jgi:hypothetical protein
MISNLSSAHVVNEITENICWEKTMEEINRTIYSNM